MSFDSSSSLPMLAGIQKDFALATTDSHSNALMAAVCRANWKAERGGVLLCVSLKFWKDVNFSDFRMKNFEQPLEFCKSFVWNNFCLIFMTTDT